MNVSAIFNPLAALLKGVCSPRRVRRAAGVALACLALFSAPMLSGCAGGGSAGSGELVIGLTDADGDFLSYSVDVNSLSLTRKDGTSVEVMPIATTVDFAQYTTMTEFLTAAMIPNGTYVSADMVLDYSNADIQVEVAGQSVAATPLDVDGAPMGITTMTVKLEDRDYIPIRPGVPSQVVFDFDLAATNEVALTDPALPQVTVDPVLVAQVDANFDKPHRMRGLLKDVDLSHSEFTLHVRPFKHRNLSTHRFGSFPVGIDTNTAFEIDGVTYTGQAGLTAMADQAKGVPVVAFGNVDRAARHMLASEVRVGTSVPWGEKDVVRGTVVARSGDTLTVHGAVVSFHAANVRPDVFRNDVLVNVDLNTVVNGPAGTGTLSIDALSVGSRVTAVGDLLETIASVTIDTTLVPTLHADKIRLNLTGLSGQLSAIGAGELTLSLKAINGRPSGIYDFTGTGSDPAVYVVDSGLMDLSGLTVGGRIHVRGLVANFGVTPPDFTAMSLIDPAIEADNKAMMVVQWRPATAHPFLSSSALTGLVPDLSGSPDRHHVLQRSGITDLTTLTSDALIAPSATGEGRYAIQVRGGLRVFPLFADFQAALTDLIDGGAKVRQLVVHGNWAADSATLTAKGIVINLKTAVGQVGPIDPRYVHPRAAAPGATPLP